MSINLRDKLKEAKKNSELKVIKNLITLKTHIQVDDITCNNINYQEIIDISYDKMKLKKNHFDTTSERKNFESFFSENPDQEQISFMVKTKSSVFFLSLPCISIKNNLDFFWDKDNTLSQSDDKIFVKNDFSKGFVILKSEYGIETGSW